MKKILILGAKGMLGRQLVKVFGEAAVGWDRADADVTQFESLKVKVKSLQPAAIINCAAYNNVDGAEDNRDAAFLLNAEVVGQLAKISKQLGMPLAHFSTNYVFDGEKGEYRESDEPHPLSVYAKSKYQGERELTGNCEKYYLIRSSVLFGPKGQSPKTKPSFVELMLDLAGKTATIKGVTDEINSLTYAPDLASEIKKLLDQKMPYGIYHVTNSGQASWYDFAKEIFDIKGKKITLVPVSSADFPRKAPRPNKSVLLNTKLPPLRPWQNALRDFLISNFQSPTSNL